MLINRILTEWTVMCAAMHLPNYGELYVNICEYWL